MTKFIKLSPIMTVHIIIIVYFLSIEKTERLGSKEDHKVVKGLIITWWSVRGLESASESQRRTTRT